MKFQFSKKSDNIPKKFAIKFDNSVTARPQRVEYGVKI